MTGSLLVVVIVSLFTSACRTDDLGDGNTGSPAGDSSVGDRATETVLVAATTEAVPTAIAAVTAAPEAAGVERRTLWPENWPDLQPALSSGETWSGSLTGWLVRSFDRPGWTLCQVILESMPPLCGDPLDLELDDSTVTDAGIRLDDLAGTLMSPDPTVTIWGTFDPATESMTVDALDD